MKMMKKTTTSTTGSSIVHGPISYLSPFPKSILKSSHSHSFVISRSESGLNSEGIRMDSSTAVASSPSTVLVAPPSKGTNLWVVFIISIAVTASLGTLLFYLFGRKLVRLFRQPRNSKGSLKDEKMSLKRYQFEELEKATNNFSSEFLLGSGSFANVYKGTNLTAEGTVAIKRPHDADSNTTIEEFRNEVKLLSTVKHKNLVALMGYCEDTGKSGERILVYEYVANGSLLDYILGREGRTLTWRQRVNIAIGAAKGIAHLHIGMKPSIIHRDIKPSNILVGDGFEAKVSDFGLVRSGPVGDQSHVSSQIKGTPGYLDPAYCSTFHLTPFSDVYSFGIILLQLISARPVFDSNKAKSDYHIVEWARSSLEMARVDEILDTNLLLQSEPCNMEVMLKMGQLGLKCTSQQPKQRPTMSGVWQELEEALLISDNKILKQKSTELWPQRSMEFEYSQGLVSIEGIRLEKFQVEMDSFTFQSASLKCLESNSICINIDQMDLDHQSEVANAVEKQEVNST